MNEINTSRSSKRRIALLIGTAILLLIGLYFASPYYTLWKLKDALNSGNRQAIQSLIDFPLLRESIKDQLRTQMATEMGKDTDNNPLAAGIAAAFGPAVVNYFVDNFVTPSGIAALIANSKRKNEPPKIIGIGVSYSQTEDGYVKIDELIPGGAAARDGQLKPNDRIVAVAQENLPFEDIINMKSEEINKRIRGSKGSKVRLQVIPAEATDPSTRSIVEITRDEVQQTDTQTNSQINSQINKSIDSSKLKQCSFVGLTRFVVDMNGPKLVMDFTGLGWKVTSLELPPDFRLNSP